MLHEFAGQPVRVFVVWEPVLFTDWGPPSTAVLGRISDGRTAQFWDRERLVSHAMGEGAGRGPVWDYVAVYPPGAQWGNHAPPQPLYRGGPVVDAIGGARAALAQALESKPATAR